jgi:hypothetical protein
MNDVIIREKEMPYYMKAYTKVDADGIDNIYVNSDLSYENKQKAIKHELSHITKNHLTNESEVEKVEVEVDENFDNVLILSRGNKSDNENSIKIKQIMSAIADEALKGK